MDVAGDAGAGGFAYVHAEVDAIGGVEFAQDGFHTLGERDHFAGGFGWELAQFVEVGVGDDHHVAGGVGVGIQDHEAMLATIHNANLGVVAGLYGVAEDASRRLLGGGNVGVAPWGPEIIHRKRQVSRCGSAAKMVEWFAGAAWKLRG